MLCRGRAAGGCLSTRISIYLRGKVSGTPVHNECTCNSSPLLRLPPFLLGFILQQNNSNSCSPPFLLFEFCPVIKEALSRLPSQEPYAELLARSIGRAKASAEVHKASVILISETLLNCRFIFRSKNCQSRDFKLRLPCEP